MKKKIILASVEVPVLSLTWMTKKKLTKTEYLGELNNGDWFKLTPNGGCRMNDYSNTLIRIIKVVKEENNFYLDNFLSLSEN